MDQDFLTQMQSKVKKGKQVYIAPTASVLGTVKLGDNASVWFGAVVRGDYDGITIGDRTNIQDNVVVHVDFDAPVAIGNDVVVGHSAVVHGATVGDNTLIGIHATILNHARIGKFCIIGANALVTEKTKIPDYSIALGIPAKIIGEVTPRHIEMLKKSAESYVQFAGKYLNM